MLLLLSVPAQSVESAPAHSAEWLEPNWLRMSREFMGIEALQTLQLFISQDVRANLSCDMGSYYLEPTARDIPQQTQTSPAQPAQPSPAQPSPVQPAQLRSDFLTSAVLASGSLACGLLLLLASGLLT